MSQIFICQVNQGNDNRRNQPIVESSIQIPTSSSLKEGVEDTIKTELESMGFIDMFNKLHLITIK